MIQRVQTLFLLLAIAFVVAFMFVPYGFADFVTAAGEKALEPLKAVREIGMMVPMCLSVLLMVIAIFCFKKLSVQKLLTLFAALLTGAVIITVVYVLVSGFTDATPGVTVAGTYWGGGGLLMIGALVAEIAAYRGMSSDQRLLRSYDSIR